MASESKVVHNRSYKHRLSVKNISGPEKKLRISCYLFIIAVFIPFDFAVGSLRINPARLVVLFFFIPVFFEFYNTKKKIFSDFALLLFSLWITISLLVVEGFSKFEYIGITIAELIFPYLLARVSIKNVYHYNKSITLIWFFVAVLCIFAAAESVFGIIFLNKLLYTSVGDYANIAAEEEKRLGMYRASTVFSHPILFGLTCSIIFAPIFFLNNKLLKSVTNLAPVLFAVFFSLSSGAYLSILLQSILMFYRFVFRSFKGRWKALIFLLLIFGVAVELLTNRNIFQLIGTYGTFSPHNAYWRMAIFEWGYKSVVSHPLFGIGLGDWIRPSWMHSSSVDNFWLLNAMRYGIPGFLFCLIFFGSLLYRLSCKKLANLSLVDTRDGMVFVLVAFMISLCTVHIWGNSALLLLFFCGSTVWVVDLKEADHEKRSSISDPKAPLM